MKVNNNNFIKPQSFGIKDIPEIPAYVPPAPQEFNEIYAGDSSAFDYLRNHAYRNAGAYDLCEKSSSASRLSDIVENHHELPRYSQSGESFAHLLDKYRVFDMARAEKIDTIIDLNGFDNLKKACEAHNFEYIPYPTRLSNYWESSAFGDVEELVEKEKKRLSSKGLTKPEFDKCVQKYRECLANEQKIFMDEFKKVVEALRRGHCYIGCAYGDIRTEGMLKLISNVDIDNWGLSRFEVVNPKERQLYRNFVKNLSPKDLEFFKLDADKIKLIMRILK